MELPRLESKKVRALKAARDLVAKGWCQGHQMLKQGRGGLIPLYRTDDDSVAVAWSLLGAIDSVTVGHPDLRTSVRETVHSLLVEIEGGSEAGGSNEPGEITLTGLVPGDLMTWNDYGYAPPLPTHASDETKAQWPKPVSNPRRQEHVIAILNAAIELLGGKP